MYLNEEIRTAQNFDEIIGSSTVLKNVLKQVAIVAPTDSTVMILGETGTGKELIARAIHNLSARKDHTFVKVNCATIPLGLLESELFGHEKGAFAGAIARKLGRFELAHQGSLFLDAVGDIPPELQPKLRVLQEQEFERLGSTHTIRVNVRLVTATSRDLPAMVEAREFREDLYYRLNIFPLSCRPCANAVKMFRCWWSISRHVTRTARRPQDRPHRPSDHGSAADVSLAGNVGELQNVIERGVILAQHGTLRIDASILRAREPRKTAPQTDVLESKERELIEAALMESKGRVAGPKGAATRLGVPASTLESKIRTLKIDKFRFRASSASWILCCSCIIHRWMYGGQSVRRTLSSLTRARNARPSRQVGYARKSLADLVN